MEDEDLQAMQKDKILFLKEIADGRSVVIYNFLFSTGLIVLCAGYKKNAVARCWNGFERRFCYENRYFKTIFEIGNVLS